MNLNLFHFVIYVNSLAYNITIPTASLVEEDRVVNLQSNINPWFTPYVVPQSTDPNTAVKANALLFKTIVGHTSINKLHTIDIDRNFIYPIVNAEALKNIGMSGFTGKRDTDNKTMIITLNCDDLPSENILTTYFRQKCMQSQY